MKTTKYFRLLGLRQLDSKLLPWKRAIRISPPEKGWLRTIRKALGISLTDLAQKLQLRPASLNGIESSEAAGTISIKTASKVAEAMNCVFIYAVVPKTKLESTLNEKARIAAKKILLETEQTMKLEDQAVVSSNKEEQLQELANALIENNPSALWK